MSQELRQTPLKDQEFNYILSHFTTEKLKKYPFLVREGRNRNRRLCKSTMKNKNENISFRKTELTNKFLDELDKHLIELKTGLVDTAYEVNDFAELLFINPNHLSDTIKQVLGKSPCAVYEEKLVDIAKDLLGNTAKPINEIARTLDYDPSNFTKFFKRFTGITPTAYRNTKTEKLTF